MNSTKIGNSSVASCMYTNLLVPVTVKPAVQHSIPVCRFEGGSAAYQIPFCIVKVAVEPVGCCLLV